MSTPSPRRVAAVACCVGRIAVALLSAPLLAAAQSPVGLGPLALVALVPWLWAAQRGSRVEALVTGALVGTAYGCLVGSWLPEALTLLGSSRSHAWMGLVLTAAWAKLPLFATAGGVARWLRRSAGSVQIGAVALVFGIGECALGTWSLGVPVALLGHSQLVVPGVSQLALVGGVALLSAWLAAINEALVLAAARVPPASTLAVALVGSWVAAAWLGLPVARAARPVPASGPTTALLVVQPDLAHRERWVPERQLANLERVAEYTDRALAADGAGVRAIVWPENLLTSAVDANPALAKALERWVDRWQIPVLSGLVRSAPGAPPDRYRSSVVWMAPGRGAIDAMDKQRAIPLLESSRPLPAERQLASLFGRAARWPKVEEAATSGPLRGDFTVTPALCYEVLFPGLVAARRAPESLAILHLADDSWAASAAATRQLTDFARFRAIEARLPLLRVAHGGLSVLVDEFGQELRALPLASFAHLRVELAPRPPPTLREKVLVFSLPLAAGAGVGWLVGAWARRRDAPRPRALREESR